MKKGERAPLFPVYRGPKKRRKKDLEGKGGRKSMFYLVAIPEGGKGKSGTDPTYTHTAPPVSWGSREKGKGFEKEGGKGGDG